MNHLHEEDLTQLNTVVQSLLENGLDGLADTFTSITNLEMTFERTSNRLGTDACRWSLNKKS